MYFMWKVIAVYTGPSGIALIEQFQNFLQIARTSIVCGINQAVVKYVAEYKDDEDKKYIILSNATILNIILCIIISVSPVKCNSETESMTRKLSFTDGLGLASPKKGG